MLFYLPAKDSLKCMQNQPQKHGYNCNQNSPTSHLHPCTLACSLPGVEAPTVFVTRTLASARVTRASIPWHRNKCSYWTLGLNWFLRLSKCKSQYSGPWEFACCETPAKLGSPHHAKCKPGLQVLQNFQFWLHWVPCKHACLRQRDKTDL